MEIIINPDNLVDLVMAANKIKEVKPLEISITAAMPALPRGAQFLHAWTPGQFLAVARKIGATIEGELATIRFPYILNQSSKGDAHVITNGYIMVMTTDGASPYEIYSARGAHHELPVSAMHWAAALSQFCGNAPVNVHDDAGRMHLAQGEAWSIHVEAQTQRLPHWRDAIPDVLCGPLPGVTLTAKALRVPPDRGYARLRMDGRALSVSVDGGGTHTLQVMAADSGAAIDAHVDLKLLRCALKWLGPKGQVKLSQTKLGKLVLASEDYRVVAVVMPLAV